MMLTRTTANMVLATTVAAILVITATTANAKALPEQDSAPTFPQTQHALDPYGNHLVDDDGSLDAALINYLFAKQLVDRLRNNADIKDLQQKRSYWKQCAFNAVSCFGKRK